MNLDLYITAFGVGMISGIGVSVWFCRQFSRLRGPGYYRRRARRAARGYAR